MLPFVLIKSTNAKNAYNPIPTSAIIITLPDVYKRQQSTNNIWQSNGIGVMGTRSITQPQIEFKLETFGESLEENYQLMKDFINDILNQRFVTLEYQTEIFQVYADLALADVTKTEGCLLYTSPGRAPPRAAKRRFLPQNLAKSRQISPNLC